MPVALADGSLLFTVTWWASSLALTAIGWLALRGALAGWHDAGWALARPLALLAPAYAIWVAGHVVPVFTPVAVWALVGAAAVAATAIARRRGALGVDAATARRLVAAEARFLAPFLFYVAMRGFSHDVIGLEKFMDFAFVNSAVGSTALPVADPWYAGGTINYYYFGHYLAAFHCKLAAVPPAFGYNLMLATIFGSVFQLAYAFVAQMTSALAPRVRGSLALIAGLWITVGANVHGFIYGFIKPWLVGTGVIAPPRQAFLVSDPTRFVGWDPPTDDKLIHEFPAYAFYVGDLHAHLSNLPAVLALLCVLLAWLRAARADEPRRGEGWMLCAAWLAGIFAMANSWDALMYVPLLAALLGAHVLGAARHGARVAAAALGVALKAGAVTLATALPFLVHFDAHSQGFFRTHSHTPAWQWLILYGLQTLLALAGCARAWRGGGGLAGGAERRALGAITLFGIAFALVPEFVYLKDIYGSAYYRGNTAFKFGFQAFTLLTLAGCVGVALLLARPPRWLPRAATIVALELALVPPLYYSWFVLQGGFGVWREREWTLDGHRYFALNYPEDQAIARWLARQRDDGRPLIEAVGDSYTYAARIATNSGRPAVLGWPVHEQLWRGSSPDVWRRRDDVARLYQAKSAAEARPVLERYRPRWLVVGAFERERYPSLDAALLASLGRVAFRAGSSFVVELDGASGEEGQ